MHVLQALYLCLTGINIKYPLDNVLVCVSDASVLVDRAEHYKCVLPPRLLCQATAAPCLNVHSPGGALASCLQILHSHRISREPYS
jgi:hypothetical protein